MAIIQSPVQVTARSTTEVVETHLSTLFFVGDKVYKAKKPLQSSLPDLTTPEGRHDACEEEATLNRRIAPDVYLGVADVVGPDGQRWDSLVVMRRLPADRSLARLVREAADVDGALRSLAHLVATFHAACHSDGEIAATGSPVEVLRKWNDNNRQMGTYVKAGVLDGRVLAAVDHLSRSYVRGRSALFEQRVANGSVRDGHGDLVAEDIFVLDDGIRVLDCIDFDPRLRYGDVLADVAHLAMDLERLGAAREATMFLNWYREFSGGTWPDSLAHHWIAYRAQVQSKVACLLHDQGDPDAARQAAGLLDLCLRHLRQAAARLVLIGGLPGTGRSATASGLADQLDWVLLGSDEVRRQADSAGPDAPGDLDGPGITARVYTQLLEQAGQCLRLGQSVIIDAGWTDERWRRKAAALAADHEATLIELSGDAAILDALATVNPDWNDGAVVAAT